MTDLYNDAIYSGVTGFRLKYPSYSDKRTWTVDNTEWIEITKRKNELPTAKLRTYVLYYRKNGEDTSSQQQPGVSEYNYRFYSKNTTPGGKQIGWFWGFPLFKINENDWPLWKSCISSTRGFEGSELQNVAEFKYNISFSSTNVMTNLDFDKVLLNKDNAQQHTADTIYLYHVDKLGTNIDVSMNIIKSNISKDYLLKITDISNNFSTFLIENINKDTNDEYWTLTVKNIKNSGDNNLITQGADVSLNFIESETFGNEKMLVDLSKNKNMIVLDFSGYSRTPPLEKVVTGDATLLNSYIGPAFNDISRNFRYQSPVGITNEKTKNFYLTLRIKKSTENGLNIHFNPWDNNQRQRTKWCSLVEYVYDCDIIYPTDMLDLMYNKFLYSSNIGGKNIRFFGEEIEINNKKYSEGFAPITSNTVNTYTNVLKFQILTGLGPDDSYATLLSNTTKHNAKEHTITINPSFNFVGANSIYANDIVKQSNTYMGRVKTTLQGVTATQIVVLTDIEKTFSTGDIKVGDGDITLTVQSVSTSNVTLEPTHEENYADYWRDTTRIMSINQIKNSLIYTENNDLDIFEAPRELQQVDNYEWNENKYSGHTITKMIGGFYSDGSDNSINIGYYGDNYSEYDTGNKTNELAYTKVDLSSNGWRWDISFNVFNTVDGKNNNLWINNPTTINDGTYLLNYDLNNILWCSLKSARKSKQIFKESIGTSGIRYRFITNYLDLSGNDCVGGGYGLYEKTIDLPRISIKPYYSDENNSNTTSISNYVTNDNQQYFTDNQERELNETQTFKVAYKLLVPPSKDETYKINYIFGEDISSVVTFFRFSGMDGTLNNDNKTSKKAVRAKETIELEWNNSSLSSDGEMPIKYIYLTDIASGSHNIDCSFNISDPSLNYINKYETHLETGSIDISKSLYDISSNIFQLRFVDNTSILPVVKEIEENKTYKISVKTLPENYIPYRYQNVNIIEGINVETQIFDDTFFGKQYDGKKVNNGYDISNAPILILKSGELYNINLRKVDVKNNSNNSLFIQGKNNNIGNSELETFENYTSINVPEGIFDISRVIVDNNFNITSDSYNSINGDFVIFKKQNLLDLFINKRLLKGEKINLNEDISYFTNPQTDSINNYFISDYWKLNKQINLSRNVNVNNYTFLSSWENQSQIAFAITYKNISLREKKIDGSLSNNICKYALINSNKNRIDSDSGGNLENEFIDDSGEIISKNNNIVFDIPNVIINTNLNVKPIVLQFFSNTLFGDSGTKFLGNPISIDNTKGITKPNLSDVNYIKFKSIFVEKLMSERDNFIQQGTNINILNDVHEIGISAWDDDTLDIDIQNNYYNNIDRRTNITALIVDISNIVHLNPNPSDMISTNNESITIKWSGFDFSKILNWNENNLRKSDIQWTVERINVETSELSIIYSGILPFNNFYEIVDNNIVLNDTYKYKVTGKFIWEGLKTLVSSIDVLPFLNIVGFETNNIFVCKFNRFPNGRFNTTSTNKKLFPNNKNIYADTSDTMTKKQTFVRLLRQKTRPDR